MPRTPRTAALPDNPAQACLTLEAACTDQVRSLAAAYRARGASDADWADAADLVRVAVLALAPTTRIEAGKFGWAATVHVRACLDRGADRTVAGVWGHDHVEHTLARPLPVGEVSRASLASILRRASRRLVPTGQPPRPAQHPRASTLGPYDSDEFAALLDAVTTIAAPLWRARASLLVALAAGAGATNADAAALAPGDVTTDGRGVLMAVTGNGRDRVVAVRHELADLAVTAHAALLDAAAADPRADATRLFPGDDAASRLFGQLAWPPHVPRPNTHRLRATWSALVFASGCGLPAYLTAAHITSLDSWMAPVAHLPQLGFDDYCAQVRGTTAPFAASRRALDGQPWPAPAIPVTPRAAARGGR